MDPWIFAHQMHHWVYFVCQTDQKALQMDYLIGADLQKDQRNHQRDCLIDSQQTGCLVEHQMENYSVGWYVNPIHLRVHFRQLLN